jgi:glycosyltransferase involved in cell wall biosynthesis
MNDVKAFFEIIKIIRQFKPDIVHTHAAKSGALGRMAAFICGVPVIVHTFHGHVFHSYFHPVKTKIFILIERFLAVISTKIVAISNLQKKELTEDFKICSAEKMEVIPLGFDLLRFTENQEGKRKQFREDYNVAEDEIAIGLVGRLVPVKNHRLFLEVINEVKKQTTKKVRFFIVGDGEERANIESYAKELHVDFISTNFKNEKALLTFTSWIKNVDYVNAGLDIITLTSFNEGTPVSVIEAQASNKPVVSTMVGGIQDVVIENETALLSASGDVNAFANNLLKLVEDDDLRNSFGKKGSQHVLQQYGFKRLAADIERLYDNLLKQ